MKTNIIASNHHELYIKIRAVSVLYLLSIKVPDAIATANPKNKVAINLVENKNENIFFPLVGIIWVKISFAKVSKFLPTKLINDLFKSELRIVDF